MTNFKTLSFNFERNIPSAVGDLQMLPRQTKITDFTKSFSNVNLSEYAYVCVLSNFCAYENVYE